MSSTTVHPYSLRARTGKTAAKKGPADAASNSDNETPNPTGTMSTGHATRRRFSDVVSGRESPIIGDGHLILNKSNDEENTVKDFDKKDKGNESDEAPDQNLNRWVHDNPNLRWTAIHSRQNRSLDSLLLEAKQDKADKTSGKREKARPQDPLEAAEKQLTVAQKEQIDRRYRNVARKHLTPVSPASRGEGPSKSKGKGVDPANWGNVDLNEEEMDPEAQQAALDAIQQKSPTRKVEGFGKTARQVKKTVRHVTEEVPEGVSTSTPDPRLNQSLPNNRKADSRPINQIPLDSYIGQTLRNIHRLGTRKRRSGNNPSSSSSSDSSGSSSDPDSSDHSDNDSDKTPSRRRRSRSKGKRRSKSKRSPKSGLKPIAPKEYNGAADARAYNRFITEGTTYVMDGRVPKNRQVFVLSYYLDGVAYDFYTQKVSMNFAEWTLQKFYEELFNYCFPVNYRMEQRLRLKRCFQNDKKVSAYVHELEELYNMIGAVDEREKVIKLWYGLRSPIQKGLWTDLLNPETSTWEEVADHAAILEIAHSVAETRDKRNNPGTKGKNSPSHPGGNPPGGSNDRDKSRGFQNNRSGSRPFRRGSSDRPPPPRNPGRFDSSKPAGSNNRFGSRAPSHGSTHSKLTPKPFDRPKSILSDKEKSELLASGKCFNCKEPGHVSRNCPKGNTLKSSGSRPPGVPSFNIELEALEEEETDDVEILYTLQVSVINISPNDIPREGRTISLTNPDWEEYNPSLPQQSSLGDAWARAAEYGLYLAQPLPGDSPWISRDRLKQRFYVNKIDDGPFYAIYDRHQLRRTEIHIEYLKDPYFRLPFWYANQLCLKFKIKDQNTNREWSMSDALGENACQVLQTGITTSYPTRNQGVYDDIRFTVVQSGTNSWNVHDDDFENQPLSISRTDLENPEFDICTWYSFRRTLPRGSPHGDPDDSDEIPRSVPERTQPSMEEQTTGIYTSLGEPPEDEVYNNDTSEVSREPPTLTADLRENSPEELFIPPLASPERIWELGAQGSITRAAFPIGDVLGEALIEILEESGPFPGDETGTERFEGKRFVLEGLQDSIYIVRDRHHSDEIYFHKSRLNEDFTPAVQYAIWRADSMDIFLPPKWRYGPQTSMGTALELAMEQLVEQGRPYLHEWDYNGRLDARCRVVLDPDNADQFLVKDRVENRMWILPRTLIENPDFDPVEWYQDRLTQRPEIAEDGELILPPSEIAMRAVRSYLTYTEFVRGSGSGAFPHHPLPDPSESETRIEYLSELVHGVIPEDSDDEDPGSIELNAVRKTQIPRGTYSSMQRNAASVKTTGRAVPKPVVITVKINGHPARALLDSGSLGDFVSTTLADQLKLKRENLDVPLGLQLAVQGSRSKINSRTKVKLQYQEMDEERYFDIINLSHYDIILGTPWLFQHSVCIGLNPARVLIGSDRSLPIQGNAISSVATRAITLSKTELDTARDELIAYAEPLCKSASETGLPPFRAINHKIPLIDENKIYPWRPSRCPEVFRSQWDEKRAAYIKTGRWRITSSGNTVPMLLIPKPHRKPGEPPILRTAVDLRARNDNTYKQTSPLPDPEGILRRAAAHPFRSCMDGKDAYEQIRIEPDHVERTAVTTPDGNMVSLVVQIGDCNAPATYQALMNHIFSGYIGRFMDIYLDDIVIYSKTLEEHVKHVKLIIDILTREKLYLSKNKLFFLQPELKILGRLVTDDGIRMDPDKVDSVMNWKTPTNRDLLRGFLGSVGYLADDIPNVRIPMAVLHGLTGDTVSFRWGFTEQRAFEDVKMLAQQAREHHRVPLDYSKTAPQIWMVTDGCSTGVAGLISQGDDWRTAKISAFYSAKLNSAQQNYPVHEIEMLAGIETMLRHRDVLQGARFKWVTDHKGLIHLLRQKDLSGRQARWCEKISEFDFEIMYVPGTENVVADALSRMYSNDSKGTVRASSEYTYFDVVNDDIEVGTTLETTVPILAGIEAQVAVQRKPRAPRKKPDPAETGRPETSKEFAARMKDRFAVRGPRQRKEGEGQTKTPNTPPNTPELVNAPNVEVGSTAENINHADIHDISGAFLNDLARRTSLLTVISQSEHGLDLEAELRGQYTNDQFFKTIIESPTQFRNFTIENGLIYLRSEGKKLLCIPKVIIKGNSAREITISEAHSLLAHLGTHKTLAYLRDHVWWKNMASDTHAYCTTCITCKRSKPSNQKPFGLLNPLPVPGTPWEAMGIDFVGPLPESKNRDGTFDSITVVICLLTGMVHLIPSRIDYNARQIAELVFEQIYKLHGLPKHIISDRDVLFTSAFWTRLNQLIGTKLKMSSAYHPETDGSTERANRTITQMLRQCVDSKQTDWVSKLPAIEFALNSARSESTGYAPFFLNTGRMPRTMIWNSAKENEYPSVRNFAQQRKFAIIAAHDSILAARVKQTREANKHRRLAPFKEKDLVYLSTKNISFPKGLARKLIPKYIGPYKVLTDFKNQSFRIELPSHLKQRGVHDVFHASLLRIHEPNDDRLFPGRQFNQINAGEDAEAEWAVDKILSHSGSSQDAIFEVLWKAGDITWLPYLQIEHLNALKEYLDLQGSESIDSLPSGKGNPPRNDPQIFLGSISSETSQNFYKNDSYSESGQLPNSPTIYPILLHPDMTSPDSTAIPSIESLSNPNNIQTYTFTNEGLPDTLEEINNTSTDVVDMFTLNNHFITAPDLISCDELSDLFSETQNTTATAPPMVVAPIAILEPLFKTLGDQLGTSIHSAVRESFSTFAPAIPTSVNVTEAPIKTDQDTLEPITTLAPGSLHGASEPLEEFIPVSRRRLPRSAFETFDHPLLRRMKYAVFCFADPITRHMKTYHAGQIVLFCETSTAIIDGSFQSNMISSDYVYFSNVFNRTSRADTTKRFATFDSETGLVTIPDNPITITDFKLEYNYLKSLERPFRKKVGFVTPDSPSNTHRARGKRADTPFPHSALPRNHYPNHRRDAHHDTPYPVASTSSVKL